MSELTLDTAKELVSKIREVFHKIDYDGEVSYGFYFGYEGRVGHMDVEVSTQSGTYLDKGNIWIDGQEVLTWDNSNTGN